MDPKDIRVLLVDDEEELIEYLSKRLLKEGFTVRAVTSGMLAVEAVEQEDFDVAVVDLKMPGMDGIECLKQLKQRRPHLQSIVLTGHGSIQAALDSGKQHAFCFLQKPADHEELVGSIRKAAEKKHSQLNALFQEEMAALTGAGGSPRGILKSVEALRKKYGLD